ncbi:nephrocystin-4 isoform X1 [Octopus bimaculoides]|uniref:Nephrocystin-4 n=1 Tax=Octopus bimaculoides TaxID=37653 RepID=A0A0L8FZR9_OCTBM|nr:nephrocystin-4 isoform X1 [Octopus bimaculoides]|eukprot:XP_014785459.1 PREDICTED: nephrocystin-4-like isoform X1 [Octopus bimaculoides]
MTCSTGKGKSPTLQFNEVVYMHTTLKAPSVVLVVELVGQTKDSDGVSKARSLGWGIIRPFAVDAEHPNTLRNDHSPLKKVQLYKGTPRALLLIDEPIEHCEHLKSINGRYLTCSISIHQALFKIVHLLPENVFFGRTDKIPGLQQIGKTIDPFHKPKLSPVFMCQLNNILVSLPPNIDRFEEELCQRLSEDYLNNISDADSLTNISVNELVSITERRLKLAVHNGWCFCGNEEIIHLDLEYSNGSNGQSPSPAPRPRSSYRRKYSLTSNGSSNAVGLVLRSPCYVKDLFDSPDCSVVLSLEYVISEPMMEEHMKFVRSMPWAFKRVVLLRWCIWKPFDSSAPGQEMVGDVHVIPFIAGPSRNPDEVFVYRGPLTDMYDKHLARMAPGNIQFYAMLHTQNQSEGSGSVGELQAKIKNAAIPPLPVKSSSRQVPSNKAVDVSAVNQTVKSHQPVARPSYQTNTAISQMSAVPYGMVPVAPVSVYQHQPQLVPAPVTPVTLYQQQLAPSPAFHYSHPVKQNMVSVAGGQVSEVTQQFASLTAATVPDPVEFLHQTPTSRHNPVLAQAPHTTSCKSLSRSTYNLLFNSGFPPILDRNGDPAEVVNPERADLGTDMSSSHRDPLSCNEIIFQFLAINRIFDSQQIETEQESQSVFFTFQFYKYPPVTTERLLLWRVKDKKGKGENYQTNFSILHKINKGDLKSKGSAGFEIRYFVDPCFLKLGEFPLFLQYLEHHILHIDVWNGDSLLLLGSSSVPLKYLCRRGNEAVQCSVELDILVTESSGELQEMGEDIGKLRDIQPYNSTAVSKGQLHLRMANIGYPPKNVQESKKVVNEISVKKHVITSHLTGESQFHGGSLVPGNKQGVGVKKISLANHLLHTHPELGTVITSQKSLAIPGTPASLKGDNSVERKRKLARMEMVKKQLTSDVKPALVLAHKDDLNQRVRDLKMLELYRQQTKRECIMNMLNSSITKEHVIFPSFAAAEFFEFVLLNPSDVQEMVTIEYDDSDLSIITDAQEWRYFKSQTNVTTPVEEDMFIENNVDGKWKQILMRPKEEIHIPFKLQSFTADHSVHPQGAVNSLIKETKYEQGESSKNVQSRTIQIQFRASSGGIIAILYVKLMFQPHVIDQTFRFYQPEQSFMKKSIHLPSYHTLPGVPVDATGQPQQVFVRCSDPNVICNCEDKQPGEPIEIFIKVSTGLSPQVKKFFVAIYADRFQSQPIQIWEIIIHALQRVDILCVEGQKTKFSLILRGTHSSRFARCFTSHPREMKLHPSEAFTLAAGSVHELNVTVRPESAGSKYFYINMVDVDYHQLLRSWLICIKTQTPVISGTFEIKLPVGGGYGCNKKISYRNPYGKSKLFSLHTNRDDLLQFKENQLDIPGGESLDIGLRFAPVLQQGSVDILVFIDDEQGKNEETFCIKANYMT